ncbi:MAG: DNA polymerase III subunit alpha [Actinomycetota bacterium]|nr:DNA polymerase III subunit alpha [Actinomycetota bacterium]
MSDPFVHLHVASGYSMRYGASLPHVLVQRAADCGMDTLALTDRDGVYGAVKFVQACQQAAIRPVLGVDLAFPPTWPGSRPPVSPAAGSRRAPARGGAFVDSGLPRVTLLAQDVRGWASMCRLISATQLAGERGRPICSLQMLAEHSEGVIVLLGPDSEPGRLLAARRPDAAQAALRQWREVIDGSQLLIEVVSHRGQGDTVRAARLLRFAQQEQLTAVLTNAVRYADRADAPTADVLDAARRLVVLDPRHVDRTTAEGCLKSGKEMAQIAEDVAVAAGAGRGGAERLLAATRRIADRCALPAGTGGLGLGEIHFPELEAAGARESGRGSAGSAGSAGAVLRQRCEAGFGIRGMARSPEAERRLDEELDVIAGLGYPSYFLTVGDVVSLIKERGVRCAARGSGAGSLVNYLLGISDVDPLRYGLLMQRFLSPLRTALPDIDIDVESARRMEIYEAILERFGGDRCTCVSMMDTYRARHAIRDVGAALGLPPGEIDTLAKAFPHIRASQVRAALRDLPELRVSGLDTGRLDLLFRLVERLDGLPRHIALHPCGVLLSDATLLDRTAVEASWLGFPMSQFDKDDVEALGLLKLDVLGIRMQSAISHAITEVRRVDGVEVDIDTIERDDPQTFALIQSTRTLGCFQIESPGQRELVGKFAPETFSDLIIDISLFRPGPVKSDMVRPFLEARQGWSSPDYLHPDLIPALEETCGVVVFHEQVLHIIATMAGCTLAEADEARRALGDPEGQPEVQAWFVPTALGRGYDIDTVERVWQVLKSFASFGFCKAHAAAFAVPTYQSAWLKAHHPAAFLAGVLTHDPGMYPKRLILDDARQFGIAVLGLDVNRSDAEYRIERVGVLDEPPPRILDSPPRPAPESGPDARGYGIRLGLADVKGITDAEIARIVAGRPYGSLSDFWHRAAVSRPIAERLVLAGGFDDIYGLGSAVPVRRRGKVTRRDLLLQVAELDAWSRATFRSTRRGRGRPAAAQPVIRAVGAGSDADAGAGVRQLAARQSQAASPVAPVDMQLTLDLGDAPQDGVPSGLPEMTGAERVRAELEVLGLDVSRHVVDFYAPFLEALGVTRAKDLVRCRSRAQVLVAGVKVATQTPPIRSGRRVIFLTLDDATGPLDATFFEDAQAGYASTLFHSWLLVVRGTVRRTGPRGVSMQADGCWELPYLRSCWETGGLPAVWAAMDGAPVISERAVHGAAQSRSTRPVMAGFPVPVGNGGAADGGAAHGGAALGGTPHVHATGFTQSPYADVAPAASTAKDAPRRLWHSSSGSSGG